MGDRETLVQYCNLLGVKIGCAPGEIKKKSRALLMKHHPDRNPANRAASEEKVKKIIEAYKYVLAESAGWAPPGGEFGAEAEEVVNDYESEIEVFSFEMAGRKFAAPMKYVRAVMRSGDVNINDLGMMGDAIPHAAGIFYMDGEIVLLWNLHKQLSLAEPPITSNFGKEKIVVLEADGSLVGFLVTAIGEILTLKKENISSEIDEKHWIDGNIVAGCALTDGEKLYLLNMRFIVYN